jgi:hypothetical protein
MYPKIYFNFQHVYDDLCVYVCRLIVCSIAKMFNVTDFKTAL